LTERFALPTAEVAPHMRDLVEACSQVLGALCKEYGMMKLSVNTLLDVDSIILLYWMQMIGASGHIISQV
jgi:hypothetical protein